VRSRHKGSKWNPSTPLPRRQNRPRRQHLAEDETEDDQQSIDRKVKRQVAEQEAERKRYCETMRTNLAQLQNNPRVRVEEKGETRRITEEERQAKIAETRGKIAENCN